MVLLNGLFLCDDGGAVGGGLFQRGDAGAQGGQAALQPLHLALGEAARQSGHDGAGVVVIPVPVGQPFPVHLGQGGLGTQNGPGQRAAPVDGGGQPLGHQILGGVLVHADLLQNDAPLGLRVGGVKAGVEEDVA